MLFVVSSEQAHSARYGDGRVPGSGGGHRRDQRHSQPLAGAVVKLVQVVQAVRVFAPALVPAKEQHASVGTH
eukprot:1189882-Prorocentrum_minimum.AAC.2